MAVEDLAIINVSNSEVSTNRYKIPPGGKLKLTDYYRSEAGAYGDLTLAKYRTRGMVVIREIDWAGIGEIGQAIAKVEARAAEGRLQSRQALKDRRKKKREEMRAGRSHTRERYEQERAEREQRLSEKRNVDLLALFEQSRKQRIERARSKGRPQAKIDEINRNFDEQEAGAKRELAALKPVPAPPPAVAPPRPSPAVLSVRPPPPAPPPLVDRDDPRHNPPVPPPAPVAEKVERKPLVDRMADVIKEVVSPSAAVVKPKEKKDHEDPTIPTKPSVDVGGLSDKFLRFVLSEYEVPGRSKIKSRRGLVSIVKKLKLSQADLRKLVKSYEKG